MKILIMVASVIAVIGGIFFFSKSTPQTSITSTAPPSATKEYINITASFTIITDKITRSFKTEKYHNQSVEVYITSKDSTIVYVKKVGITWDDFFKTLPMQLTKDCLTTGDGEKLCGGKNGSLKFYLNNAEVQDVLDKEIKQDDKLLVRFISS